jgi:hypothetical protein
LLDIAYRAATFPPIEQRRFGIRSKHSLIRQPSNICENIDDAKNTAIKAFRLTSFARLGR